MQIFADLPSGVAALAGAATARRAARAPSGASCRGSLITDRSFAGLGKVVRWNVVGRDAGRATASSVGATR
jgi:hypothetical protein